LISLTFVLLGIGTITAASPLFADIDALRSRGILSLGFQWFIGLLLVATGTRSLRERATIIFDKTDSSVTFLRHNILPARPVSAGLTECDSVVLRPSIWGGSSLWHCVSLTWKDGRNFGLTATPNEAPAQQIAAEVSEFLGIPCDAQTESHANADVD
jgi:hypothetical protein